VLTSSSSESFLYLLAIALILIIVLLVSLIFSLSSLLKRKKEQLALQQEILIVEADISRAQQDVDELERRNAYLVRDNRKLTPFAALPDIFAEVEQKQAKAKDRLLQAKQDADKIRSESEKQARQTNRESNQVLKQARERADAVLSEAHLQAQEIAGEAWDAKGRLDYYQRTALAMKNKVNGYGDDYLIPNDTLIDDLADDYGHEEAGRQLKIVRDQIKIMIHDGTAADSDYKDPLRRQKSIEFVVDAFNGKAESIIAKVKTDNYGIMKAKLEDAFQLVNHNGKPFKNARILPRYAALYQAQLKYAIQVKELKQRDLEQQRTIKAEMREEELAQREFKKAQKHAEKEQKMIRKAIKEAESNLAKSNDGDKLELQAQLEELEEKLSDAKAKNQRVSSMAQQTRRGHVYIVSNVGSFGENVLKIGKTRRLEPMDRINELGDASVPFSFDVHAIVYSEDAPKLERILHEKLQSKRVNKVNFSKAFFSAALGEVRAEIESLDLNCQWTMKADAQEFRESIQLQKAAERENNRSAEILELG